MRLIRWGNVLDTLKPASLVSFGEMYQFEDENMKTITTLVATCGLDRLGLNSEEASKEQRSRKKNQQSTFSAASDLIKRCYFHSNSIHSNKGFESLFCISKEIFYRIEAAINEVNLESEPELKRKSFRRAHRF